MKLEAADQADPTVVCVATVANVLEGRVLVHFDGWETDYDYWVRPSDSTHIRPVGWCQEHGVPLVPPRGMEGFHWPSYLSACRARPVPASAFALAREVSLFRRGSKLEAVDRRNPGLIRVATVADTVGRQIKVPITNY